MVGVDVNIYSLSCYTFIVTSVVCAVIRWCHMCKPYDKNATLYYPARKQVTFFFAALILQMPYVLRPMDGDTWFFARTFGILYYSLFFSMVLNRFFFSKGMTVGWWPRVYFMLVMGILLTMMIVSLLVVPSIMLYNQVFINVLTGAVSLFLSLHYVRVSCKIIQKIDSYHEQNFSNVSDFPYVFAKKVILMPLLWVIMEWMVFVGDSRSLKAITDIISAVSTVLLLAYILSPRYKSDSDAGNTQNEEIAAASDNEKEEKQETFEESIRREVLSIVARRYKEPCLKRVEVISEVAYRRKKAAGDFITSIGFYRLVNMFRLYHMESYSRQHPEMTKEGAAISCGFKDRFALNNARKRIPEIDMTLIRIGLGEQ